MANFKKNSQIPSEKELTQEMKDAFQGIEVHEAQQVTMKWIVRAGTTNFESHPQGADGHVSIVNGAIRIFLEEESLKHEHFPMRVARRLTELYGLEDPECLGTINFILNEPDEDFVQRVMQKRGYAKQSIPPQLASPRPPTGANELRLTQIQNDCRHDRNSAGQGLRNASQLTHSVDKRNQLPFTKIKPQKHHKTASILNFALKITKRTSQGRVMVEKSSTEGMPQNPNDKTLCVNRRSSAFSRASPDSKNFKWSINSFYESELSSKKASTDRTESIQNDSINSRIQRKLDYFIADHDSFIVDPGIPDRPFRELRESSIFSGTDTAEVVFLSDSDSTAEYRKKIAAMDTLPASISMGKQGFLTAFINLKSKAQTELIFHAEVLVSQAKIRVLPALSSNCF